MVVWDALWWPLPLWRGGRCGEETIRVNDGLSVGTKKSGRCMEVAVSGSSTVCGLCVFKKESTRSSINKWTKALCRDYLHRITNFCATVLNIFSKEIVSNNTKCRKVHKKHLKVLVK